MALPGSKYPMEGSPPQNGRFPLTRNRPPGISSRVRRARGDRHPWVAPNGTIVDLPIIVDIIETDPASGSTVWSVEARVDLEGASPALVSMHVESSTSLDPDFMQQRFRWSTPLDIATVTIPELIVVGIDPFRYSYPLDGYPDAAHVERSAPGRLTDEFLTEIAIRYVKLGRGYAKTIAAQRNVSPRTVVSWIERARARGILSPTIPGAAGGRVMTDRRPKPRG